MKERSKRRNNIKLEKWETRSWENSCSPQQPKQLAHSKSISRYSLLDLFNTEKRTLGKIITKVDDIEN